MKIQFLTPDCTEAVVTRGLLWWKRQALVLRGPHAVTDLYGWTFAITGRVVAHVDFYLAQLIHAARNRAMSDAADRSDWQETDRIPRARLVERGS
jgi:hypothetical protein